MFASSLPIVFFRRDSNFPVIEFSKSIRNDMQLTQTPNK
jgi:hypothetical protein